LQRPVGELWQQAIEAGRQVVLDFADLLIDDVEIVEQPFRRGEIGCDALVARTMSR